MRIVFSGIERSVAVVPGRLAVLEVENKTLFSAICQSLISGLREDAIEPYMLFDDDDAVLKAKDGPLIIVDPFSLPWGDKDICGALYTMLESELLVMEETRSDLNRLAAAIADHVSDVALQFSGDYCFDVEWSLSRYLKAFGFAPERFENDRLIDNLEKFLATACDVAFPRSIIFINLKNFLESDELDRFASAVKNSGLPVLLIESSFDPTLRESELKQGVDQRFLEY